MKPTAPAALLAIPLATAFAGVDSVPAAAEPIRYDLTVNPTIRLTHSYLFVASMSPILDIVTLGAFAGGSSQQITHTDNDDFASDNAVVFLGVYQENDDSVPGLSVSLVSRGDNNETNPSFADLFGSIYDNPEGAEDSIVSDLRNGNFDRGFSDANQNRAASFFAGGFAFPRFFQGQSTGDPEIGFGSNATTELGNFSLLSDGGTISVTRVAVIPEPASLALLGVGGLLLAARRHR